VSFAQRFSEIRGRIAEAAVRSGRNPEAVTLLGVTKSFPPPVIQEAYDGGLRLFGENRVQEFLKKGSLLPSDIHWHFIGQLQTNKINKMLGMFELVHSVDSLEMAQALSKRLLKTTQDILLEVNTSGETTKSGVKPEETLNLLKEIGRLPGLHLRGLMTVGPLTENIQRQKEAFKVLKGLFDQVSADMGSELNILSMGMSGDFEMAIEEGSTMVRVGSALFGKR
jgi:PLP dependent protein